MQTRSPTAPREHPTDTLMKVPSFGPLEDAPCGLCHSSAETLIAVQHLFGEDFRIVRCQSCGLIRTNPRPTPQWKSSFYDPRCNSLPERLGRDFIYSADKNRLPPYARMLRFIRAQPRPGNKLLDVGTASGIFVKMAGDHGFDAVGCDYCREALAFGQSEYQIRTIQSPAESVATDDNSFDVVTMLHTIEHLPDPLRALREMHRILRPGGMLVLETPNYQLHYEMQTRLRSLVPIYQWITGRDAIPWVPYDHYYHWTPPTLREALQVAGFHDPKSHHLWGYRSETQPNFVFRVSYLMHDLLSRVLLALTAARVDLGMVQIATARK